VCEAEESPLVETVAREWLVKTQQAGRRLSRTQQGGRRLSRCCGDL
jgi:hypothetical protein